MNDKSNPLSAIGKVTLVGAGPGDPELLTLKAVKAIRAATVLLVDDLVGDDIVAYASPGARIVHVGKRGGCKSTPQAFIEKLMVMAAREGENVVRLKGGDPFIFGRGGEEVEHLKANGIEVEIVNGITAGLAAVASLGVPLTHREHAHGVVFVTGHAKPGSDGTNWRLLAATARDAKLTLVIYMGVSGAARIQQELLSCLPATTPVAVVQRASLPDQRHAVATLGELGAMIERDKLASPSVIVVGPALPRPGRVSRPSPQCADVGAKTPFVQPFRIRARRCAPAGRACRGPLLKRLLRAPGEPGRGRWSRRCEASQRGRCRWSARCRRPCRRPRNAVPRAVPCP
jgi:uroporphyrin-III C-methyltransferase